MVKSLSAGTVCINPRHLMQFASILRECAMNYAL